MSQIMAQTNGERKFQRANTLKCESSRERKYPSHFTPGSESFRKRESQGAKGPESKRAKELIGQGPTGRFAPGSELAREQKGYESWSQLSSGQKSRSGAG